MVNRVIQFQNSNCPRFDICFVIGQTATLVFHQNTVVQESCTRFGHVILLHVPIRMFTGIVATCILPWQGCSAPFHSWHCTFEPHLGSKDRGWLQSTSTPCCAADNLWFQFFRRCDGPFPHSDLFLLVLSTRQTVVCCIFSTLTSL